ncbi:iron complex transport system substrate-binding protein [Mucilaginibacter lappiensis]|uniref:Iron complex transport system substrate-binding protein n=1 Tax=Mucilaginibacter lappiensis TaxID=354630 RepID=A0ABR6PDW3_9SPHI|nr:ABC transporter substrate-binding protein [Mucilaginibacter lappiensis]MBB6107944.1 iron complex transport system substrate-binding protein [Mucilaginibacter lappiensis]SIP91661.1 iron complex transport system substrate-binding protein [Mucilaginibacter lappiensis]
MKRSFYFLLFIVGFILHSKAQAQPKRIVTLNGALTETVDALGLGKNIVAVDVTSTYPAYVNTLPKVSKNRSVSAEGLISFNPDVVLAPEGSVSKEIESQINAAGIKLVRIKQVFTIDGTYQFIRDVAAAVNATTKGDALIKQTKDKVAKALALVKQQPKNTKVLFIYARGPGVMMVAGKNTHIDAIISLAGGKNAVNSFNDFKPYTTEALVEANPDVILMFDFGFSSLGGMDNILKIPGMAQTNAGKNKRIVQMDADLLINFSTRLDQAILQLHSKI